MTLYKTPHWKLPFVLQQMPITMLLNSNGQQYKCAVYTICDAFSNQSFQSYSNLAEWNF